tara:strand:+ start:977 stop:1933 length:957 start_codon:yes stop_codon:yes gene_type:complete
MTYLTNLPDNKQKPFGGAYSVYDEETVWARDNLIKEYPSSFWSDEYIKQNYFETYKDWMGSTNNLYKLEDFTEACFTQGTTEAFYQFYIRYRNRRLRLFKGEYFFHQMMSRLYFKDNFAWLDEEDIDENDVVLISCPFSDTGDTHILHDLILNQCEKKNVPVMLDLAYINLTVNHSVDLSLNCIKYVVTSLSKVFPVELHRIGLRLQREEDKFEDQLYVINEPGYNYLNVQSMFVGLKLMKLFPADYIYNKYQEKQKDACKEYNLSKSPCVYFGLDLDNNYKEYNRGNETNRLCFSRIWDKRMGKPNPKLQSNEIQFS